MKDLYLLRSFLFIILSIFLLLLIEVELFDQVYKYIINKDMIAFLIMALLILIFWLLSIRSFYKFSILLNKEHISRETDRLQLEENQKLIQTLRSQRHDFCNQLQVIRVLSQFNRNDEVIKYIDDCKSVIYQDNALPVKVDNPTISALMLVFATEAKEKGINFNCDFDIDFVKFNLSPAKVTRILGNIIRNAIEALNSHLIPEPSIQVTIWETADNYYFLVWNNGPIIKKEQLELIFSSGFSTKGSTGLGLNIVRNLIEEWNGKVKVDSREGFGTEFKLIIPKVFNQNSALNLNKSWSGKFT